MNKLPLLALTVMVAFIGCTSVGEWANPAGPTEVWTPRVGTYTYSEAVTEYGPPDTKELLDDGTLATRWRKTGATMGNYAGPWDLRLYFSKDKKLTGWDCDTTR